MSLTVTASHFKGGQVTYKSLGEGQYEMTIKGYWDKDAVGSIVLTYEGAPRINTGTVTLSKTLLPDGMTVEHVQRQRITWSKPGLYQISWRSCCRANGSNFGSEESGLFAAIKYDANQPSSSPQFYDLPVFNFTVGKAIRYNMNVEDPDRHGQEYSLELPYGISGDPYKLMKETGFHVNNDGTINWERPLKGLWLVNVKIREKINGEFTGAFVLRDFILNITDGTNTAPVLTQVAEQYVTKGETFSFDVLATDAQQQNIKLQANSSMLEKGAMFSQLDFGHNAKGTFTWATKAEHVGRFAVQFTATDSDVVPLSSQMTVYVNVLAEACTVKAGYTLNQTPCVGSNNGEVTLSGSNGIAPYTYSLDGGQTFQAEATFSNLAGGAYGAVVKDAKGCTTTAQVHVTEETLTQVSLNLATTVYCLNSGPATLSGGTLADGTFAGNGVIAGVFYPSVAGLGKHTIMYSYTNANGCTNTISQEVEINAAPVVSAGVDQTVIIGYNKSFACATLTASSASAISFLWSNGATTQSIEVCPTATTVYTVTITDQYGCTSSDEVTVFVQDVRCGNKMDKVVVCHNGKPICIAPQAVQAHLDHGDVLGDCSEISSGRLNQKAEGASVAVFPNPMVDRSQLRVVAKTQGDISIDILDMNGKVVRKLHNGIVNEGQELNFDLKRNIGPNNIYIGRVVTEFGVQTFKIMITE
ncbi:T9SS type A sorting domain-containing protein [Pontibacter sp. HSC-36F09]|uniref:T9SS type A sorting domain-containing protein n=1 Tax=Pontibacter sp. HSC-36F09 TaxID=2910966 RepID=UPI0020A0176A|nr:T9SS type A sorting domain-containing protein [Pontibacter sp. HSC-36F09]MCP2043021.1 hypothetical protein [Pontibacter sp. HSC-36F09]